MATIVTVENISKSLGDRTLFTDIGFGIEEGDKIGLIARNGTGKSTLMSIIAGVQSPDSGQVVCRNGLRIGYLPQQPEFSAGSTVLSAAMEHSGDIASTVLAYENAIATDNREAIHTLTASMDAISAWDYKDKLHQVLGQLGLFDMSQPVAQLSGGQRKRLAIARLVMQQADFLLLDEPTNHLDISTVEWLEKYLSRSRATLLMVTHDRYFLDRVCSKIIEMDCRSIFMVEGNYDMYIRRRAERIEAMDNEIARVRNTLRREQEWISRQPQARGGKAKYRIDAYNELKERSRNVRNDRTISLEARASRIGSKIFEAVDVCKSFGDKTILKNFSYVFAPGEKIGIVGENGVGKSTFIKMLQGLEPYDSGSWEVGTTVHFGYYSQDGIRFDPEKKVIDAVRDIAEDITLRQGRNIAPMQYLERFLFSPADQQKFIRKLSGGERCRLQLAVVLMQQPNFLILDEPTNDLDIITLGILEEYLADFEGCVIVVSHDRFFLDAIADHIFVMEGDGIVRDFPGSYSEYRAQADCENRRSQEAQKPQHKERSTAERPAKMTYRQRKEFESLEEEIAVLTDEKKQLEDFFASGDQGDFAEKSERFREVCSLLDEKEMRWLELSEIGS